MWILSPNGLQRYDGSRFVNYPYDRNDPSGITYKQGCAIFADKKNNCLWITHENIRKLDLQKNSFIAYSSDQLLHDPQFSFETYTDPLSNNWFAGNFGVIQSGKDGKLKLYSLFASRLAPGRSNSFFIDHKNNKAWLADWSEGLLLFDRNTKKVYSHNYNPLHDPLLQLMDHGGLFYVFTDNDGNTWISSGRQEFYKYNPFTQKLTAYSLTGIKQKIEKNNNPDATLLILCFFEDDHHALWIGTQNAGLLKYDKEKDSFISITGEKEDLQNIRYNYEINCIFQDSEENIWLGTDKGITIFNPYRQYFHPVYHDENDPRSLPKYEIQECIETKNGDILAGTWGGGIAVYDEQWHFKRTIYFPHAPEEYNLVWCFIQNDNGTIWVGCQHGYIHIYDPVKETIFTIHPPELKKFTIRCMAKDKDGNILFGLHDGKIAKWNKAQNKFYSYNNDLPGIQQSFAPVQTIYIDNKQHCWAGTENGLKEFDMDKMIYAFEYVADRNNPNSISANVIQSIDGADDSTIIMGTVYGGLDFFNTKTRTFSHFGTGIVLPSNTINNVKKDAHNNIWFTTDYDLYKYVKATNKFIRYNFEPGLINSSFKSGNFYCLSDGRWIASTTTEIISFHPDSLQKQEDRNLQVDITGLKIFDKNIFIDSLLYANKPLELSYRQNFLSFEYGVLSFSGLQETQYYYQLSGIDKDWVNGGTKRIANYTNLEPGQYVFNVKAGDRDSRQKITSFTIIIQPPFWKTLWFRTLLLVLAIALIYLLFRKRIKAIRHEAELKQKIAETEMMALRAQMNPHFIFNCINSIDALIQSNDKYHATVYLNKFAKLIRNILDSSKQNAVTLSKDLETLQLYVDLELFRNENKFTAEIRAEKSLLQDDYKVPPLIIQPYVENAILHGLKNRGDNEGKLSVSVARQNGQIEFVIEDNGVGRSAVSAIKHDDKKSYGMQMSLDRVKIFNKEETASVLITDLEEEGKAAGTRVRVRLKI
jgi:ligand-binding sensor domain-containing protein/two-component sensor histidine kinase